MEEQNHTQKRGKKRWPFYVIYTFILSTLLFLISGALRDPPSGEFEPRVPIKQDSTAGSEMVPPFLPLSSSYY
jgi:hypothetical protein